MLERCVRDRGTAVRRLGTLRGRRRRFAEEGLADLADRPRKAPPVTTVTDEVRDEILIDMLIKINSVTTQLNGTPEWTHSWRG
ncbi:MAG: hypothetical protein ACRDSI_19765 [Pseudonocardiaceae bacterium]